MLSQELSGLIPFLYRKSVWMEALYREVLFEGMGKYCKPGQIWPNGRIQYQLGVLVKYEPIMPGNKMMGVWPVGRGVPIKFCPLLEGGTAMVRERGEKV